MAQPPSTQLQGEIDDEIDQRMQSCSVSVTSVAERKALGF